MKAVVFIDVQNDFVSGALRNEKAIEVVPKIVEFAKKCRECSGTKLYATRDTHKKTESVYYAFSGNGFVQTDRSHAKFAAPKSGYLTTLEGQKLPVEHCIEGTDGWQIVSDLMDVLDGNCTFVNKPTFGSYDLVEIIREDNIEALDKFDEIVICGFCTDICCVSNALMLRAAFPDIRISFLKDFSAGTTLENHNAAICVMKSCQIEII